MSFEDLLLKKEDISIQFGDCFVVPIHPALLSEDIEINPTLANQVFPKIAKDWHSELKKTYKNKAKKENLEWIRQVFVEKEIDVIEKSGKQLINPIGWKDGVETRENGFAFFLSCSRNYGGQLIHKPTVTEIFNSPYLEVSPEKKEEYSFCRNGRKGFDIYHDHNIEAYPGALFMRNWAIAYLNTAITQLHNQGHI